MSADDELELIRRARDACRRGDLVTATRTLEGLVRVLHRKAVEDIDEQSRATLAAPLTDAQRAALAGLR